MMRRLWIWLAWHLPEPLVYWCAIRVGSYATTGKNSRKIATDVTVLDALDAWRQRP